MTTERFEVDLDTERVLLDGAWLGRAELSQKITAMISSGDFKIGRPGSALEQLDQAIAAARTLTLRLSGEAYARLEAAGQKLGKTASEYARNMILQALGQAPAVTAPAAAAPAPTPVAVAPVAPAAPAPAPAPVVVAAEVSPEEAAAAVTMQPKRRDPAAQAAAPSVVVDMAGDGRGGDARKWFNR